MNYNFDEIIPREGTDAVKYDFRQRIFKNKDVIPMWVADMDFKTPDFILEALKERMEQPILGYTLRSDRFNNSVVDWVKKRHDWQIKKEWISYTPGVVSGLAMVIMAFTKPGDKIIIQTPVYHPFYSTIKGLGRQLLENKLIENDRNYEFDFEGLEKSIDSRTKMLFLSNPHNPVGRVWKKDELAKLGEICVKHDILIIADDIHSDLILKPNKYQPIAQISQEIAKQTITFLAASKTFNLAGLSTAVMITSNKKLFKQYNNTLEDLHLFVGNIFGNIAMLTAYEKGEEWLEELLVYLQGNIDLVADFLEKKLPKIKMKKPEGTYLAWLDFREYNLSQKDLNDLLINEANLGLNSGDVFGEDGTGFQRINLACSRKIVQKALENIEKTFANLK